MTQVFLSHTSADKPFVERLARDLTRLGIEVWYDKYEIQVGESIFQRVSEGLGESEYFAIVLSPRALKSEWVRSELSAAWCKKMLDGSNAILSILYQTCEVPALLQSIRYADFREDYRAGMADLARVFDLRNIEALDESS